MLLVNTIEELRDVVFRIKSNGKSIGFVPTMGALHKGHLSLLERAKKENEVVACSIFINPVQFNNSSDFERYPKTLEKDVALIEELVDIAFVPSQNEVYPEPPAEKYNFGALETVMEGAFRPGHFNGVAIIVKRLFDWILPDKAYFGEKDYQQLAIIKALVKQYDIPVQIVACPIKREKSGLAMSSRNQRLSRHALTVAAEINRILQDSLTMAEDNVNNIREFVVSEMNKLKEFTLEYFEIVDGETLQGIHYLTDAENAVGCIAAYIEEVRLIDNIRYK